MNRPPQQCRVCRNVRNTLNGLYCILLKTSIQYTTTPKCLPK